MIIALVYHRIHSPDEGLFFVNFEQHLKKLLDHYSIVVPGDKISYKTSICLTFDDAYFDFYHYVFPLLKRYNIKAVLSVPTAFIKQSATSSIQKRLSRNVSSSWVSGNIEKSSLCTWQELQEMAHSGLVILASHGHNHLDLRKIDTIEDELVNSKILITTETGYSPDIFSFPYGETNASCRTFVEKHYRYSMRIGTALNFAWDKLTYRVCATAMCKAGSTFGLHNQGRWLLNCLNNKMRGC